VEKVHVTFGGDVPKTMAPAEVRENAAIPLLSVTTGLLADWTFMPPEAGHDTTTFTFGCAVPFELLRVIVTVVVLLPGMLVGAA
jgi:hypothetical protein